MSLSPAKQAHCPKILTQKESEEIRFPGLFFRLELFLEPGLEAGFFLFHRVFVVFWRDFGGPVWMKSPGQNGRTNGSFWKGQSHGV